MLPTNVQPVSSNPRFREILERIQSLQRTLSGQNGYAPNLEHVRNEIDKLQRQLNLELQTSGRHEFTERVERRDGDVEIQREVHRDGDRRFGWEDRDREEDPRTRWADEDREQDEFSDVIERDDDVREIERDGDADREDRRRDSLDLDRDRDVERHENEGGAEDALLEFDDRRS